MNIEHLKLTNIQINELIRTFIMMMTIFLALDWYIGELYLGLDISLSCLAVLVDYVIMVIQNKRNQ